MRTEPIRNNKVRPITPRGCELARKNLIPDEVIQAANELLIHSWSTSGRSAHIRQDELVKLVLEKMEDKLSVVDLFNKNYLDIERVFEDYGWDVNYNSEAPASFSFKAKETEPDEFDSDY